ncbi:TetR/AcrR family transcriptional regulator [Flindersiella endophytica]
MSRLSRAEAQERNRAKVLVAARAEFAERGYRDAKIDAIAERAELTRGAVYSNFPGKRALYFAVLADAVGAEAGAEAGAAPPGGTAEESLAAFARSWVARLPLAGDEPDSDARLGMHVLPEILADEFTRVPFAQLMRLNALLLGLALERLSSGGERRVRVAETALTMLHGAGQLAAAAPGFVDPFNVVRACAELAAVDFGDSWLAAPWQAPVRAVDAPWAPPAAVDALTGEPAKPAADAVVAVLGLHRLEAIEQAIRAVPPGRSVTAVLVTGEPGELGPLARLVVGEACVHLRQAFPRTAWPKLSVVFDEPGAVAAAAGVRAVSDETEVAIRVSNGRILARAEGYGACHLAATT